MLTSKSAFAVEPAQRDAWVGEISLLKLALDTIDGTVFLEFDVPRIGRRIDAVIVAGPAVFVIEFKRSLVDRSCHAQNRDVPLLSVQPHWCLANLRSQLKRSG